MEVPYDKGVIFPQCFRRKSKEPFVCPKVSHSVLYPLEYSSVSTEDCSLRAEEGKGLCRQGFFACGVSGYTQCFAWNFSVTKLCSKYC